ncbi:MAG TPA: hydroxyectoine utilization dehydratase EutB [Bacillales bacterium]|nr:hydroxyectoine utilization dehydratase EutB [Bacillales bacterium]
MVTIGDIWQAKKRIAPIVKKTPLLKSQPLSKTGGEVYLKLEQTHDIGAFKVRGAANKILSLPPEKRERGVTTFSTGNHGLAVSFIAERLGIEARICVSRRVPKAKTGAIERFGGTLEIYGDSQDEAARRCWELKEQHGMEIIQPFDDPHVIAGQGTIGLELLEDAPELDSVIVPLSGGGLISGIALALKKNLPDVKVIGLSVERSAAMVESLKAGRPVEVKEHDTLADSLLGGIGPNNRYTFDMTRQYVDETILVNEKAIADGMSFLFREHRMVVEGAAAIGVGALLNGMVSSSGRKTAVILTGNNTDLSAFLNIVQ